MGRQRLKWMDHYRTNRNAALTCRYFGISRQTFYRWKGRYNHRGLSSLEERSHRPARLRKPTWSLELALAVLHLREQYPRWGKDKLVVVLRERGWQVLHLHGGPYLDLSEGPRGAQGATPQWYRPLVSAFGDAPTPYASLEATPWWSRETWCR